MKVYEGSLLGDPLLHVLEVLNYCGYCGIADLATSNSPLLWGNPSGDH